MKKEYDYYSIQKEVDGFGNDTYTLATFKTKEECEEYLTKQKNKGHIKIVGQYWGEYRDGFE